MRLVFVLLALVGAAVVVTAQPRPEIPSCSLGAYFSPNYEGGVCICPRPYSPPFVGNVTVGNFTQLINSRSAFACQQGYSWDVVACACIPECRDDFVWSGVRNQCVCERPIECRRGQIFDPARCRCADRCSARGVQCIYGTHFDESACKCVPNRCQRNFPCPQGTRFSAERCQCVAGGCRTINQTCIFGFHFDNSVCQCVPNQCSPSAPACGLINGVPTIADPNQGCACVNATCVSRQCPGAQVWNSTICGCACNANTCLNGTLNATSCECSCPDPLSVYNPFVAGCICRANTTFDTTLNACVCNATTLNCTGDFPDQGRVANLTGCACSCNATAQAACVAPLALNDTCGCSCPLAAGGCCGGIQDPTTCACVCPLGQLLVNGTCSDPCPGVPECPFGSTLDFGVCSCVWNCTTAPACAPIYVCDDADAFGGAGSRCVTSECRRRCRNVRAVATIPDPYEGCECTEQCAPRNCPPGSFQMLEDCRCHAICGNVCPQPWQIEFPANVFEGDVYKGDPSTEQRAREARQLAQSVIVRPDYNNACICPTNCTALTNGTGTGGGSLPSLPIVPGATQIVYPHLDVELNFEPASRYSGSSNTLSGASYGSGGGVTFAQTTSYPTFEQRRQYRATHPRQAALE